MEALKFQGPDPIDPKPEFFQVTKQVPHKKFERDVSSVDPSWALPPVPCPPPDATADSQADSPLPPQELFGQVMTILNLRDQKMFPRSQT